MTPERGLPARSFLKLQSPRECSNVADEVVGTLERREMAAFGEFRPAHEVEVSLHLTSRRKGYEVDGKTRDRNRLFDARFRRHGRAAEVFEQSPIKPSRRVEALGREIDHHIGEQLVF